MLARHKLGLSCVVALLLAPALAFATRDVVGPPARTPERNFACDDCQWIVLTGDILLGDGAAETIAAEGWDYPLAGIRPLLDADFTIGNAEAPITADRTPYDPDRRWSYNAEPEAAAALARAGFDALGLANNHVMDRGPNGIADTLRHIRAAGMRAFGAGATAAIAAEPLMIDTRAGKVAIVALGHDREPLVATGDRAGLAPVSRAGIERGIALARARGAVATIGYVHWGDNYAPVDSDQRDAARELAAAGYDLVLGHHAHVVQPVERIDGLPVAFSLGNFVFGTPGRYTDEFPGYGLVARVAIDAQGLRGLELRCVETDNERVRYQPRPCDVATAHGVFARFAPSMVVRNGVARMSLR